MNACEICLDEDGTERPGVAEEFDSTAGYYWVCEEHHEPLFPLSSYGPPA
jgi:hypothetical protein